MGLTCDKQAAREVGREGTLAAGRFQELTATLRRSRIGVEFTHPVEVLGGAGVLARDLYPVQRTVAACPERRACRGQDAEVLELVLTGDGVGVGVGVEVGVGVRKKLSGGSLGADLRSGGL